MSNPNNLQMVPVRGQDQAAAYNRILNEGVPPYPQTRPKTRNEHLYETAWRKIDGHHAESTSFNAILDEAKVQNQVVLDISRTLRKQNKSYHNTNNSLNAHCRTLTNTISVLDRDLKQAQGLGGEAERQKIEIQQQLHARNEELAESVATAEALRLEIETLKVQVKDMELLKTQVQDLEASARDVQQVKQDAEAQFEEQRSKWEEEVAELKTSEKNALEATHTLQLKYDTLAQEKQQLQEDFELSERNQEEALAKASEEHKNSVRQLKMDQLRQVREVRSDCNAAHQEQVNLSTLKYAEIMKEKDSAKAKEVAKRDELQRAYDKLEQDNASKLENLRTVQSELEASTSEASELKAQIDTREGDLHQLRQELNEAKSEVAGQKKSLEAVEEDLSTLRESAAREKNEIEETRATWDRERGDASRDKRKQAAIQKRLVADLEISQTALETLKTALETAQSAIETSAAEKARAEEKSIAFQARVEESEKQSAKQLLEAQSEAEELRSRLEQAKVAADRWKKTEEFFAGFGPSRGPSDDPDNLSRAALIEPTSPSSSTSVMQEGSRKRIARPLSSELLPKIPRV